MKAALLLTISGMAFAQPPADRGINFYSIEKEIALGDQLAANFRQSAATTTDPRLDQIGRKLTPPATRFPYRFFVYEATEGIEPAVFPGGWIFVPRQLMMRDDAQFAAIVAHAIGHVELRHRTRIMTKNELGQIGQMVAQTAMPQQPAAQGGSNPQVPLATLKMERSFESAADYFAVQLLRKTGFDPNGLVVYLRSLPAVEKPMFSKYPLPDQRAEAAQKAIAELGR